MSATPGPWAFQDDEWIVAGMYPEGSTICRVDQQNREANAKLIAAAPDMASAIQTLFTCDLSDLPGDVVAMLRSAISKATGTQERNER